MIFFIKGLINGEDFLFDTYNILNIEKNIEKKLILEIIMLCSLFKRIRFDVNK